MALAPDLVAARTAFLAKVGGFKPSLKKQAESVLDALIEWSQAHDPAIRFTPHVGRPGSEPQDIVKYCVPGVDTPFWAAYPRKKDGAKLHVLTDRHPRFAEGVRDEVRRELARIDGREPDATECPVVSFVPLVDRTKLGELLALLSRTLPRVQGA